MKMKKDRTWIMRDARSSNLDAIRGSCTERMFSRRRDSMFSVKQYISGKAISGSRYRSDDWAVTGPDHRCTISPILSLFYKLSCSPVLLLRRIRHVPVLLGILATEWYRSFASNYPPMDPFRDTRFHPDHNYPRILISATQTCPPHRLRADALEPLLTFG